MSALLLSSDLMLSSKVAAAGQRSGVGVTMAMSVAALVDKAVATPVAVVILDLGTPGVDPAALVPQLRSLAQPPRAIVAFGPHVQTEKLEAAAAAGCDEVFSRGQFHAQADEILTRYAAN